MQYKNDFIKLGVEHANELLNDFFSSGKELKLKRREPIIHMDEQLKYVYWIKRGVVNSYSHGDSGNTVSHYYFKHNELFPATALFDKMPKEVGFSAFTDATVMCRKVDDVIQFMHDEPECMYTLLDELTTSTERIATLNTAPAEQRIAKWLATLMNRFGHVEDNHVLLSLGMTIQEFADGIRLSRESAGKILNNFEGEGIIIMGHKRMIIYPEKLNSYMEYSSSSRVTMSPSHS